MFTRDARYSIIRFVVEKIRVNDRIIAVVSASGRDLSVLCAGVSVPACLFFGGLVWVYSMI